MHPPALRVSAALLTAVLAIRGASSISASQAPAAAQPETAKRLPDDPKRALVERACTGCHTLFLGPHDRQSAERWEGVVREMITRGAEISADDSEVIVDYLDKYFGLLDANTATSEELQSVGLTKDEATALVAMRSHQGQFTALAELTSVPGLTATRLRILESRLTVKTRQPADEPK